MGCAGSTAYPPPPEPENKPLTELELAAQKKKEAAAAEMAAINAKIASSPTPTYGKEKTFKRKFEKRGIVGERHQKPKRHVADGASSHVSPAEAARIKSSVASKMATGSLARSLTRKSRRTNAEGSGAEGDGDAPARTTTRLTRAANAMRATSRLTKRHTTHERTTHHHHTGVLGAMEDVVDRMTHVMAIGFLGRVRHRARGTRASYDEEEEDEVPEEVVRARASDGIHELEPAPEAAPAPAPADDEAAEEGDRVSA